MSSRAFSRRRTHAVRWRSHGARLAHAAAMSRAPHLEGHGLVIIGLHPETVGPKSLPVEIVQRLAHILAGQIALFAAVHAIKPAGLDIFARPAVVFHLEPGVIADSAAERLLHLRVKVGTGKAVRGGDQGGIVRVFLDIGLGVICTRDRAQVRPR